MSTYCNYETQHCRDQCCDRQGYCPEDSGYACYYYYNSTISGTISSGAIAGVIIAGIFFIVAAAVLIVCCRRHNAALKTQDAFQNNVNRGVPIPQQQTIIVIPASQHDQPYNQPIAYVQPPIMEYGKVEPYIQPDNGYVQIRYSSYN